MTELPAPRPCRLCGQPVRWITTAKNAKPLPLDAAPSEAGHVFIQDRDGEPVAVVLSDEERAYARDFGMVLHVAHFATCPEYDPKAERTKPSMKTKPRRRTTKPRSKFVPLSSSATDNGVIFMGKTYASMEDARRAQVEWDAANRRKDGNG